MSNALAGLNDLVREAYEAQEAFDNWNEGKTYYHSPFARGAHYCTLQSVAKELDEANRKLVQFITDNHLELVEELSIGPSA